MPDAAELAVTGQRRSIRSTDAAAAAAANGHLPFWRDALATRKRPIGTFFLLYGAEGIPRGFAAGLIATQMHRQGLDPAVIGAHVVISLVYSLVQCLIYGSSIALFMDITTPAVAETQFTAYMALSNLATSYSSAWQGLSISHFGYPNTLLLDVLVGMAPLLLLWMAAWRR